MAICINAPFSLWAGSWRLYELMKLLVRVHDHDHPCLPGASSACLPNRRSIYPAHTCDTSLGNGIATVYRYIREAIAVLAALAPSLAQVMRSARRLAQVMRSARRLALVILDGTCCRSTESPQPPRTTPANTNVTA
jgi:hypothetical protein